MAKRRVTPESGVSGTGAASARNRRKHSPASVTPAAPSPENAPAENSSSLDFAVETRTAAVSEHIPDSSEVARLAYSYWEARGCQGGSPEDDWLRAEQELSEQQGMLHARA